eukprot:PhF_6_TR35442/c1_g1_i7/m.51690
MKKNSHTISSHNMLFRVSDVWRVIVQFLPFRSRCQLRLASSLTSALVAKTSPSYMVYGFTTAHGEALRKGVYCNEGDDDMLGGLSNHHRVIPLPDDLYHVMQTLHVFRKLFCEIAGDADESNEAQELGVIEQLVLTCTMNDEIPNGFFKRIPHPATCATTRHI